MTKKLLSKTSIDEIDIVTPNVDKVVTVTNVKDKKKGVFSLGGIKNFFKKKLGKDDKKHIKDHTEENAANMEHPIVDKKNILDEEDTET